MTKIHPPSAVVDTDLIEDIKYNCDISDARDHGIYSLCTMVLKLRNLYKWERGLQPWEEPESVDLLNWIEAKENYWETIADESFRPLSIAGRQFAPLDLEDVNATLNGTLLYGAGFGRSMKTVFFLAEVLQQRTIEGCPVVILGTEQAREMASPFAMVQDGLIILRKQPLRTFLWDQIQEARSSCKVSLRLALKPYGLVQNGGLDQELFKGSLDAIVDQEMDLFLYHEVGEMLQGERISEALRRLVARFPGSVLEFVGRAVKDILADTHPAGPLAYIVREQRPTSLGLYLTFFDSLREKLFPEIRPAGLRFAADGDWLHIEQARRTCWLRNNALAQEIEHCAGMIDREPDNAIVEYFNTRILAPLGLDPAKTA
jgi:hypothetical protein